MALVFNLLQQMSVFLVLAYLFSKSPAFRALTGGPLRLRQKALIYLIFSCFSIMGTYFGLPVQGAIANTRAIGAVLGGLIGGPVLGTAIGLTGGLHRYALGGFTASACGVSTTVEGLLGGLVHLYLTRRDQPESCFSPKVAFGTTFYAEMLQMLIILALARPFDDAWGLVKTIALPMMLANSTGAALFMSMMRDQKNMFDRVGARISAKALKVADSTLDILTKGFNEKTAAEMVEIIRRETGVGAVAITDRTRILAFSGMGDDHHRPGLEIVSPHTLRALEEKQVVYADGVKEPFNCARSATCPLGSALVAPLVVDQEAVGTIILFEPQNRLFLNLNRSLGEGIASLLSQHLLRARYEEQKSLLTQSELKLVQAQVNPHFLFNALNTIIAVVRSDADTARELLRHLSNFFRKNLKRSSDLATLEEELDHVRSYLTIEKARFTDRLRIEEEIEPGLGEVKMPTFTLQPIVENAIKHGISALIDQGVVKISARRENDDVIIQVEDNAGTYCDKLNSDGLGMNLVDRRIRSLFGSRYGLETRCEPDRLTCVSIRLPAGKGTAP
ncbi:MAG: sensor histidine kinase [Geothermobacteraceae bacterium]